LIKIVIQELEILSIVNMRILCLNQSWLELSYVVDNSVSVVS